MSLSILIVDDEENARRNIGDYLSEKGYEVFGAGTMAEARESLKRGVGDIVLLDVMLPDGFGPNLLYETAGMPFRPPFILFTAYGDIETAVEAMKNGAQDFLSKPVDFKRLERAIEKAGETILMRRELDHVVEDQRRQSDFVVGKSGLLSPVLAAAKRAGMLGVSVLITGNSGTGKEVLAKYIHASGPRASKVMVSINCAAIQPTMLESELFGYEKGAFTSADAKKVGLLEIADGSTLFMDEISSMPMDLQAKMLRVVEERAFRRVGGTKLIPVDVHILAASNRDLKAMIANNQFREDLYYRLKVLDLNLPTLKERKDDIPELVGFFINYFNRHMGVNVTEISPRALEALTSYDWPGNIRELRNAIERAFLFCDMGTIELEHLPLDVVQAVRK